MCYYLVRTFYKYSFIYLLILIGIFELSHLNTATHAATSETVSVCTSLKKVWAKQLVNAILRSFLRNKEKQLLACQTDPLAKYMHPQWLIGKTQKDWPEDFENILFKSLSIEMLN